MNLTKFTIHTEPFIKLEKNDQIQNRETMPGQESGRWEKNLQVSAKIRKIRTLYKNVEICNH